MPRYALLALLGLAVLGFIYWQNEGGPGVPRDSSSAQTAQATGDASQPLSPEDHAAYIALMNRALQERLVVYKGRLRISGGIFGAPQLGVEYVPLPLISVRCDRLFGVEIRGPGSEGETAGPTSMPLAGLFSNDAESTLHADVLKATNSQEVLDEVCRMTVDELSRLSEAPPP